jgi:MerR family redox-sensitive transcriptional activator SoxR
VDDTLTIGQLAQRVGLATSAIRFYERTGVLPEPERVSGRRRYGPDAVRRLEVLRVATRAGFSLDEARVLLQSADAGRPASEAVRDLAARKLPDIDALVARAQRMRAWMLTATDCTCTSLDVCALFDAGCTDRSPASTHSTPASRASRRAGPSRPAGARSPGTTKATHRVAFESCGLL